MDFKLVGRILVKDLRLGPRSPLMLWALVLPVFMTVLLRGVFGGLLDPDPRLGIADLGGSQIVEQARALEGVEVRTFGDGEALRSAVAAGAVDAGIVLPEGFDEAVRGGTQPPMELWISGQSGLPSRGVVLAAILGLVRDLSGTAPPVDVEVVTLGEAGLAIEARMVPLLVMMAVAIAGGMVPAASLVEEKERRTLTALLVSPATTLEVLVAKGLLGWVLAMAAGTVTLALNDAFGAQPLAVLLAIAIGAVMMAEIGLLLGAWAPDTNTLFAAWKGGALLLIYPVVFFLWPDLPTWLARLGPTYYFLQPVFAVSIEGATLADVALNLLVAVAVCAALVPAVRWAAGWLERRLGEGRTRAVKSAPPPKEPAATA